MEIIFAGAGLHYFTLGSVASRFRFFRPRKMYFVKKHETCLNIDSLFLCEDAAL